MSKRAGVWWLAAFGIYGAASLVLLVHSYLFNGSGYLGDGTDPSLYVWMFRMLPWAIAHGQSPLILREAWAPAGLNITQATTTPLLALLAWPLTAGVGPVVAFNIISMLVPAFAAISGFMLAREVSDRWLTAVIAGWVIGFSTYVFAQLLGHLQVSFVAFLPLGFLLVRRRSRRAISAGRFMVILACVLTAEFLTSLEGFVTEALFIGIFALAVLLAEPDGWRRFWRWRRDHLLIEIALAYGVVSVVVSPFIMAFFNRHGAAPATLQMGSAWVTDLGNLVVPTPVTWLGGQAAQPIAIRFNGNWSECDGYIGAPLLIMLGIASWQLRRERTAWPFLALMASGLVLSFGPILHVFGVATLPMPWRFIERLPLMNNALPSRLMIFALIGMAGVIAIWLDRATGSWGVRAGLVALSLVMTLPSTRAHGGQLGWWRGVVPPARLFDTSAYRKIIGRDQLVLILPFGFSHGAPMFWQAKTGGNFRMMNGYGNFVPAPLDQWPAVQMLAGNRVGPDFTEQFDGFAQAVGLNEVIVRPGYQRLWGKALLAAGWQATQAGGLRVFVRSAHLKAAPVRVSVAAMLLKFEQTQERALRGAARCLLARNSKQIDPATAIKDHCLSPAFGPPHGNPTSNWTRFGGWLGASRGETNIGIGVTVRGDVAQKLTDQFGAGTITRLFPYPTRQGKRLDRDQHGLMLDFYPRAWFEHHACCDAAGAPKD